MATESHRLAAQDVWRQIQKRSFAVVAHAAGDGRPHSSGIVYWAGGGRLYVAVAPTSLKARQIADGQLVSVTVPVRRGGLLALLLPIPPATITFEARATVHPAGSLDPASISKGFARILPSERRSTAVVLELAPEGRFLTYGIGVSLGQMRDPSVATARVAVS